MGYNNSTKDGILCVWKGNHIVTKGKRTRRNLYVVRGGPMIMNNSSSSRTTYALNIQILSPSRFKEVHAHGSAIIKAPTWVVRVKMENVGRI